MQTITLPPLTGSKKWYRIADTSFESPEEVIRRCLGTIKSIILNRTEGFLQDYEDIASPVKGPKIIAQTVITESLISNVKKDTLILNTQTQTYAIAVNTAAITILFIAADLSLLLLFIINSSLKFGGKAFVFVIQTKIFPYKSEFKITDKNFPRYLGNYNSLLSSGL